MSDSSRTAEPVDRKWWTIFYGNVGSRRQVSVQLVSIDTTPAELGPPKWDFFISLDKDETFYGKTEAEAKLKFRIAYPAEKLYRLPERTEPAACPEDLIGLFAEVAD